MEQRMLSALKRSKRWQRVVTTLSCLVVFVTTYALILPVITLTGTPEPVCGMAEHTHREDCYQQICSMEGLTHEHSEECYIDLPVYVCLPHEHDETCAEDCAEEHEHTDDCIEWEQELICEESTEPHVHTEDCYTLICGLTEHTHTDECFNAADGEDISDTEEPDDEDISSGDADTPEDKDSDSEDKNNDTLTVGSCDALYKNNRPILTGNWAVDLLETARGQLGYTEDTEPERYTMYGAYYGEPAMDWDAAFVSWCLRTADIPEPTETEPGFPQGMNTLEWYTELYEKSLVRTDEPTPEPGDLVFFAEVNEEAEVDERIRVGVLREYSLNDEALSTLTMVLGDWDGKVAEAVLDVEALDIYGWARMPQAVHVDTSENIPATYDEPASSEPLVLGDPAHHGQAGSVASRTIQWLDPSVDGAVWTDYKVGQQIPANAVFRVTVKFDGVYEELLEEHSWLLRYDAEPILTDFTAHGIIRNDDGDVVGEFTAQHVDDKNLILLDYTAGAQYLKDDPNGLVGSEFYYEGRLNLDQLEQSQGGKITLAGIEIIIPDADDAKAEFASVTLDKQTTGLKKDADGSYYIEYTLTVTAGEYGSPNVRLVDQVTANNASYIGGYIGLTGTSQTADGEDGKPLDSGSPQGSVYLTNTTPEGLKVKPAIDPVPAANGNRMAWVIGDMAPNEVRTLTYRVAVDDSYIGLAHQDDPITNTADLFSKNYERGTKVKEFNPTATAGISKKKTGEPRVVKVDGKDVYEIDYAVTVTADSNNAYPMSDVKIYDVVNGTEGSEYASAITLLPDSIRLYKGTASNLGQLLNLSDYTTYTDSSGQTQTRDNPRMDTNSKFNVFVGDLAPGESRTVIYTLRLDIATAQQNGSGTVGLFNNSTVFSDEVRQNTALNASGTRDIQSYNRWVEKSSGNQTQTSQTVTFPDGAHIYDATQHTPSSQSLPIITDESGYTIPAGSYAYTVKINQNGEWDVTAATWKDSIQGSDSEGRKYMKFLEYVRVDVYEKLIDSATGQAVPSPTIKETVWVKIDDQWEFAFTGKQIGLDGSDAYVLTYYTEAILPEGVSSYGTINADNKFGLSGTVGNGSGVIINPNISQTVTVSAKEPGVNDPYKAAWYYDAADKTFDSYHSGKGNGAQYWVIKVSGQKIPKNMQFQESTRLGGWNTYLRNNESLLGFYIINFPEGSDDASNANEFLERYPDYAAFKADLESAESNISVVPETYNGTALYEQKWSGYTDKRHGDNGQHFDLTLQFKQDYTIPSGSALYLLIKTDPVQMPGNGQSVTYYNKCNFRTDAMGNISSWPAVQASQVIVGPEGSINKQPGSVYKVENAKTDGTWNEYFSTAQFYRITPNGKEDAYAEAGGSPVDTSGSHNTKDRRDLQNSVVIVANSVDEIKAQYARYSSANQGGNSMISDGLGYRITGDQYLNYAFDNGTYVTWTVQANKAHNMSGPYIIEDELPDGVELAYVRLYQVSGGYGVTKPAGNVAKRATLPYDFGADWTQWTVVSNRYRQQNWMDAMVDYSTNGNRIKIYMPNVEKANDVTFQIVAKLTGEAERELLLGDIFLNNQATLYDAHNNRIESSGAEVRVVGGNVNKQLLMDGKYNDEEPDKLASTVFPYRLVINNDREDMVENSDVITLPLVDRMTGNMTVDMSTLRIYALPYGVGTEDTSPAGDVNLIYYGGSYSNKEKDKGHIWYTTDTHKIGTPVGYLGNGVPINIATRPAVDAAGNPVLGSDGSQMSEILFENLPDETRLVVSYSVSVKLKDGNRLVFDNKAFWDGHEENSGGESESVNREYKAAGRLSTSSHGAVHIVKRDSASLTSRLEGAVFGLYRAEYIHHTPGMLFYRVDENTLTEVSEEEIKDKHWNAVYVYTDDAAGDKEVPVIRDPNNGILLSVQLTNGSGNLEWMDTVKAHSLGYELFHKFLYDDDGNLQLCSKGALAYGKTDASGNLTYGLPDGKNVGTYTDALGNPLPNQDAYDQSRIHFNKVYCIKEEIAPTGYERDEKCYYFVVPSDIMDGTGLNYFYHDIWPDDVHVCVKSEYDELTFMHDAGNTKIQLSVSKDFAGSLGAYRPGTYSFGLWSNELTTPSKDGMLASASITYTDDDFGTYTDAQGNEVYGLKPGHIKTAQFPKSLDFGTYYIYELNTSGTPILNTGTIAGYKYTPEFSGESKGPDSNEVVFDKEKNEILATNRGYSVKLEKNFRSVTGELLPNGLIGTYKFGIWPESEIGADGRPTTSATLNNTQTITWTYGETYPSKTVEFTGLLADTRYYIFEIDAYGYPIKNEATATLENGKFLVSYSKPSGVVTEDGKDLSVTASNAAFAQLPHTGGMGTEFITYGGFALMCTACLGYIVQLMQRRRKGERH